MKKTLLLFAAIALLGVACTKETTEPTTPATPSELILGKWFGDEQSVMVSVTGAGPLDTSFTQTTSTSWMRLTFNSDGTGQVDSLGLDADLLTWTIQNNDLLVLDGMDTLMITKLNSTNLDLSITEMDDSNDPILIEYDETIKFTK